MKRLLQINTVVNSGSTGRITEEIGQIAIAKGWKSYIAYGRNDKPSQSELIKIGTNFDIYMHGMQTRLFDRHGLASKEATKKLIRKIKVINPDIIHLHNIHGYYLNIEMFFSFLKYSNTPVVWTIHDCWSITGHCVYFDYIGCEKWKSECFQCPQKTTYPASYFIDRSSKNYKLKRKLFTSLTNLTLVPVSNWLENILKESFLEENHSVKVIHNGINTDIFHPLSTQNIRVKYSLTGKFILLGVAIIWSPRKGLNDFIELSKMLDSNFQIILVGLTQKQIKKLPKTIIGIKRTESINDLAKLYSASDVFLNLTYEDNFPTTNLESLACGTPVITYKTGGSHEAIDNSTGIVVEKGDLNNLNLAIKHIKWKGKKFFNKACIKRANQLYKKEDRYLEYLDLYETLISKQ